MVMQFFLSYVDQNGMWVISHYLLAVRYMRSWFMVDVVRRRACWSRRIDYVLTQAQISILPFDLISFAMGGSQSLEKLQVFRVIRLLRYNTPAVIFCILTSCMETRLAKMFRILRASRIFNRWEAYLSIPYSHLKLSKFLLAIIALCHWVTSLLALRASRTLT